MDEYVNKRTFKNEDLQLKLVDCPNQACLTPVLTCARYQEAIKTNLFIHNCIKSRIFGFITINEKMVKALKQKIESFSSFTGNKRVINYYYSTFKESVIVVKEILNLNIIFSLRNIVMLCLQLARINDYLQSDQSKISDENKQHLKFMMGLLDRYLIDEEILLNYANVKSFSNECSRLQYYIYYYMSIVNPKEVQSMKEAKDILELI